MWSGLCRWLGAHRRLRIQGAAMLHRSRAGGKARQVGIPSWNRSILTEIYLCHACSYQEIHGRQHRVPHLRSRLWRRSAGAAPERETSGADACTARRVLGCIRQRRPLQAPPFRLPRAERAHWRADRSVSISRRASLVSCCDPLFDCKVGWHTRFVCWQRVRMAE
jgi:hypothetical protein